MEDPPDVVLLDIEMPGLAGADALIAIQAVAPAVKVIMVSGTSDAALAQRTLARGAFDYVTKPVDLGAPHAERGNSRDDEAARELDLPMVRPTRRGTPG